MANRSALIRRLSLSLQITYSKAHLYGHRLADAGLITSGGRGRYAAEMTSKDTALIIIAMMAVKKNSKVTQVISNYTDLKNCDGEKFINTLDMILNQLDIVNSVLDLSICKSFPYAQIRYKNGKVEKFLKDGDEDSSAQGCVVHILQVYT